ncbi:MAG TPA: DUF4350 domain-containing protein [Thermoanaerobaculia bacterium]
MSRRALAWGCAAMAAAVVLGTLVAVPRQGADASALAADSRGWLAARRYLERRGAAVTLADAPLGAAPPGAGTWVLAFPWQGRLGDGELAALTAHLRAGGTVLLAYSRTLEQYQEQTVLETLGLDTRELQGPPPLVPWRWWAYQRRTWVLEGADGWDGAAPELAVPARRAVPRSPAGAEVLYRWRDAGVDLPLIFSYSFHRGRVVALPADVLANGYLLAAGHADLLESLRRWLGEEWRFDEYHHGLVDPRSAAAGGSTFAWDLFMLHLALFYALGFLGLARRFGPPWREAAAAAGSTAAYLRQLGALHRELGHHRAAARLLGERARRLDPALPDLPVPDVTNDAELVRFARRLTRGASP